MSSTSKKDRIFAKAKRIADSRKHSASTVQEPSDDNIPSPFDKFSGLWILESYEASTEPEWKELLLEAVGDKLHVSCFGRNGTPGWSYTLVKQDGPAPSRAAANDTRPVVFTDPQSFEDKNLLHHRPMVSVWKLEHDKLTRKVDSRKFFYKRRLPDS